MQNLHSRPKFCGRFIMSLRGELGHFPQSNRRQKQQKEPSCAPDIPAGMRPKKPGDAGNRQYNDRGKAPTMIGRVRPPRASQDDEGRNDRKEKKDMIEIHPQELTGYKSYIVTSVRSSD